MLGLGDNHRLKGRPFHGVLASADASAGVAIPLFIPGSTNAASVGSDERLIIVDYHLVAAAGGACAIYAADTAVSAFTVAAGTVAANGGFAGSKMCPVFGNKGAGAFAVAPAGVLKVVIEGLIIKVGA
jgi:hypothetical protein